VELTYPDRPSRCETRYRKQWLSTTQDGTTSGVNMQVSPKGGGGGGWGVGGRGDITVFCSCFDNLSFPVWGCSLNQQSL